MVRDYLGPRLFEVLPVPLGFAGAALAAGFGGRGSARVRRESEVRERTDALLGDSLLRCGLLVGLLLDGLLGSGLWKGERGGSAGCSATGVPAEATRYSASKLTFLAAGAFLAAVVFSR